MAEVEQQPPRKEVKGSELLATPGYSLPTGKAHVSFSELNNWLQCSYRHKLQAIDRIDLSKPSYHLIFGSAIHEALEDWAKTRVMKPELAHAYIQKYWNPAFEEPKEKDFSIDKLKQQVTDILADVPAFMEETFPGWELVSAEQGLYEAIEGRDARFKGFIDLVIKTKSDKGKEKFWILDWKSSGGGWSPMKKREPLIGLQLTLYKHFWVIKTQLEELSLRDVQVGYVILKRKAKPGNHCELFRVSVGEITMQRGLKMLNNMVASVERGIAIKNRQNCQWCDYKQTEHCR